MTRINKYHQLLIRILNQGRHQQNKKGGITYLINEQLSLTPGDLLEIFETHGIARKKTQGGVVIIYGRRVRHRAL